jgi:hypothetical protein
MAGIRRGVVSLLTFCVDVSRCLWPVRCLETNQKRDRVNFRKRRRLERIRRIKAAYSKPVKTFYARLAATRATKKIA